MAKECNSNWEILEFVTSEGIEYSDAVYLVTRAVPCASMMRKSQRWKTATTTASKGTHYETI